jgi:hypothetical protein
VIAQRKTGLLSNNALHISGDLVAKFLKPPAVNVDDMVMVDARLSDYADFRRLNNR